MSLYAESVLFTISERKIGVFLAVNFHNSVFICIIVRYKMSLCDGDGIC